MERGQVWVYLAAAIHGLNTIVFQSLIELFSRLALLWLAPRKLLPPNRLTTIQGAYSFIGMIASVGPDMLMPHGNDYRARFLL